MKLQSALLLALISCAQAPNESHFEGPGTLAVDQELSLACTLSSPQSTWQAGDEVQVAVRIENNSEFSVPLIGSLDASDLAWRYPHCVWERWTETNGWQTVGSGPRCGNTNDLRSEDILEIGPGEALDPYLNIDNKGFFESVIQRGNFFAEPGEYRLRFRYSTETRDDAAFRGDLNWGRDLSGSVEKQLARVPRVTLVSNELTVTVAP